MELVAGIEPALLPYEGSVLPLTPNQRQRCSIFHNQPFLFA